VIIGPDVNEIGEFAFRETAVETFEVKNGNKAYKEDKKSYILSADGKTLFAVSPTFSGTFTAQNIGRGQVQRVHMGINRSNLFLLAFGCVLCAGMYLARDYLPYIFTSDSEVVKTAARGIGIMCFVCTFNGFDRVLLNAMRAAGRSVVPMITAQFGCFSRIFFGWLIAVRVGNSDGIFYSLLLASFARMAAIAVYYYIGSGKQAIDRAAMRSM